MPSAAIAPGTESFLNQIRQAVWAVNASLPVASVRTMQEVYGESLARTSFTLVMLGIAGAMALALGIIGIYGVISYAVSQRTREIGIRLALGAQPGELRHMFVRYGLTLAGVGVAIGLGAAAGPDEADEVAAVRDQSAGSDHICRGARHPGDGRGARQLLAGAASGGGGPGGGSKSGVT